MEISYLEKGVCSERIGKFQNGYTNHTIYS